jgi:hypothetical protein
VKKARTIKKWTHFYENTELYQMTNSQLGELYHFALQSRQPSDGEFDAWLNVLGGYAMPDVDAAIRRWQSDTEIEEYTQKPRGARMPTATELKRSIELFDRAHSERFIPCGECEEGWIRVYAGFTSGGNPVDPKIGAVRRCSCFTAWKLAKLAGKKAMP